MAAGRLPGQRDPLLKSAEVRGRAEGLPVERPIVVLARERRAGREGVVAELPVAGQHLGPAIQPRALAHIDARMRTGLVRVIGAAPTVIVYDLTCRLLP